MVPLVHRLALATVHPIEILDLTDTVRAWVRESGVRHGLLTVMSPHTTARITINEREGELQKDMVRFLEWLAPADGEYGHNRAPVDDRLNAHSHLIGLFLNASESIPVVDGHLLLGGWQSLFFLELDGPRASREVVLHLMGAE
ncbi:MAG: secondary thiamine-phosphate synthase enzyme YjbQ [Gemmatimonadaceae bacterium]